MINCPECEKPMKGRKCSCGYFIKGRVLSPEDQEKITTERTYSDARHIEHCRQWLAQRGIIKPTMSEPERQKAMADYRNRLAKIKRPGWRDWAGVLVSKEADGEILPTFASKLAHEVIGQELEE